MHGVSPLSHQCLLPDAFDVVVTIFSGFIHLSWWFSSFNAHSDHLDGELFESQSSGSLSECKVAADNFHFQQSPRLCQCGWPWRRAARVGETQFTSQRELRSHTFAPSHTGRAAPVPVLPPSLSFLVLRFRTKVFLQPAQLAAPPQSASLIPQFL